MNFDAVEGLTYEQISELYDEIVEDVHVERTSSYLRCTSGKGPGGAVLGYCTHGIQYNSDLNRVGDCMYFPGETSPGWIQTCTCGYNTAGFICVLN